MSRWISRRRKSGTCTGQPIHTNITDNESGKLKGPHGSIQEYKGIAVADGTSPIIGAAEAFESESESEQVTAMVVNRAGQMQGLKGKDKLLEGAIGEGDRGYCTEHHLKEAVEREIEGILPDPQFRKGNE
jgi:hypothetical protein